MAIIKNYRWLIVVMLFTATTINYLDRQIIGLLKPILEKEFEWTETDFARIVMAFTAAYAIGLLISGRMIDKIWRIYGTFTASYDYRTVSQIARFRPIYGSLR